MTIVLAAFATYYLALSISREDGPFAIFLTLRNNHTADDWIGRGLRCLVCMSCWTALLVTIYLMWIGEVSGDWPIVWLGLSGASVTIDKWWRR